MICPKCKKDLGQINPWEQGRCPYCNYDLSSYDPYAPIKTPDTTPHVDYEPPAFNPSTTTSRNTSSGSLSGGVGDSITGLGNVVCVIGIIASIIGGTILISKGNDLPYYYDELQSTMTWGGILVMFLGSLFSWVATLLLRGFGQLVSDAAIIRQILQNRR